MSGITSPQVGHLASAVGANPVPARHDSLPPKPQPQASLSDLRFQAAVACFRRIPAAPRLRLLAAWRDEGVFIRLNGLLRRLARTAEGCTPEPSACIIDAQSVKTST
ncbi:hypothetical protein AB0A72_41625 [Streptosporangium roseum]